MKRFIRLLVAMAITGAIAFGGLGSEYIVAQESIDVSSQVAAALQATEVPTGGNLQADDANGVNELPSTGRGSVMTAAETQEIVTEQIVLTIMVLAAVVSVALASLALFARQRDL